MPLPVPNLDDRRFDDLVAEAKTRLATHLPELTQITPGDPVHSLVDVFAWLTETILFRANLIPERQRRVFLNLLQIPVRPAQAARGVVCIDGGPTSILLPPLIKDGTQLRGGKQTLTTIGELQPTCLSLQVASKQILDSKTLNDMGITLQDLHEQFGLRKGEIPKPYQPKHFHVGQDTLNFQGSLDNSLYLACIAPKQLQHQLPLLRENLSGIRLSIALAPADSQEGESINQLDPRNLVWELASHDENGVTRFIPLQVMTDSSQGARKAGVVRLRLPKNTELFKDFANADPMFDGLKNYPPALEDDVTASRVALWIRLRCPEDNNLQLSYLGLNSADVIAQGLRQDLVVGIGTGLPDQVIALPDQQIDNTTLQLQVEHSGAWKTWKPVDFLAGQGANAEVFRVNPDSGFVYFGDGLNTGKRPPEGSRVRIVQYRYGGGSSGNLAASTIKEIVDGSPRFKVRHEYPLSGGRDAESIEQAEQRIPQFLTHRNRAVTKHDFKTLAQTNPMNPVARAEVIEGFLPGATIQSARNDVPGVVSVFVMPPADVAIGNTPKPTQGLLKDVFQYLLQRILIGTELYVLSPEFIPIAVSVLVEVRDPTTEQETLRQVQQTITEFLWALNPGGNNSEGWPMGGSVRSNELFTQAARVEGVQAVTGLALFELGKKGWRTVANGEHTLKPYQLPELMGVRVESGSGKPKLPDGIGNLEGSPSAANNGVAVPVIPDVC